jgi:uncharacterized protein YndB with AHSA1/START domain
MDRENDPPEVRATVNVHAPPQRAFDLFTHGFGDWWMPEYTWSGPEALGRIGIEPREGGLCYEIGPYGFRLDWGRVLVWEAPRLVVFTWQISPQRVPEPDPTRSSEVEVRFAADGAGTRVDLVHRHFDRHGDGADAYRGGMAVGWEQLLGRFAEHARRAA